MQWGAIAYNTRSSVELIPLAMTAQWYVHDILKQHVLPLMQWLQRAIFQQDNARSHTAKVSQGHSRFPPIDEPKSSFGSPEPASSFAGKRHYGSPILSVKVVGISNIRLRILVYRFENDQKSTFSTSRLLRKAPVMVHVIDVRTELSGKFETISHMGYEI
ncbi:hypothetical protein TNCV_2539241 [Trichonephila clavipes]|nr:hypothetical protein TNCV_2539241 [Trichonephila clavipes]